MTANLFQHKVLDIEHIWIPLSDGCKLAARIWLPDNADRNPVPAVLEYIPYGKRFGTRWRDEPMHRYFAGHGYAAIRIDLRGTGESDGLFNDEYAEQELQDGLESIRWIASQPWCSGSVGMIGKSWGGLNSLQIAYLQPQELKAVITVCSSDDRYTDDAHYMGGCLLVENLVWGSMLLTLSMQPPDPDLVGSRWREMWIHRLENSALYPHTWLQHQIRDEYWKHGSVCEDYSRIQCPVYAVGGWADAYTNAIPRLLSRLSGPRKGLIGPWAHVYPHRGIPGPAIGFLQEALRWWDHWLKGIDTGMMNEPMLRVWMQQSVPPRTFYETRPGTWIAEESWIPEESSSRFYSFSEEGLSPEEPSSAAATTSMALSSPQTTGLSAGSWCSFGMRDDMPGDQKEDDEKSLTFDSDPLREELQILGAPVVSLRVSANHPAAFVVVRLNDVHPDGASTRVTFGVLNLTHRSGHDQSRPITPGKPTAVKIRLNDIAYCFPVGHRLRISISTSYWPIIWPSPEIVALRLFPEQCSLQLPVREPKAIDGQLRPFDSPESAPLLDPEDFEPDSFEKIITRNQETGETTIRQRFGIDESGNPCFEHLEEIDLVTGHAMEEIFRIRDFDPQSAAIEISHHMLFSRKNWQITVKTNLRFHGSKENFHLVATAEAWEKKSKIFSRNWDYTIPRIGV